MKTSSCKAKGRRACQEVKELLHEYAKDLRPGDIEITSSGAIGEDIKLSPAARERFPLVIECKNTEKLNIWEAIAQAESHHVNDYEFRAPVVFFRRNRSNLYAVIKAENLIKMIS